MKELRLFLTSSDLPQLRTLYIREVYFNNNDDHHFRDEKVPKMLDEVRNVWPLFEAYTTELKFQMG